MVTVLPLVICLCASAAFADDLARRGLDAIDLIERTMRRPTGLYAARANVEPLTNASAWAAGVQLSALNAAAQLDPKRVPAAHAYAVALDAYRFQPATGPLGYRPYPGNRPDELFYDDNAWLALAFLDTYRLSRDPADLARAREAFAYLASGESADLGGGIWWSSKRGSKNACANAPAIVAALELYAVTHDAAQLQLARRLYSWVARLQDADGLFLDHLNADGTFERTKWSYNSALMIRANVRFFEQSGDRAFLAEAARIADAAEARWFRADDGALTDEASFAHLLCECLLELDAVSPRPATAARVRRALDALASRGPPYPKRWDAPRTDADRVELLDQASAARAFIIAGTHSR